MLMGWGGHGWGSELPAVLRLHLCCAGLQCLQSLISPQSLPCLHFLPPQEYGAALKVVKVEADANKATLEKYKVRGWAGQLFRTEGLIARPSGCWRSTRCGEVEGKLFRKEGD